MKLALISDLHYGVREDKKLFLDNNKKFFNETFFPALEEHFVDHVVCLGDLLHRRRYVNYQTATRLQHDFLYPLFKNNKKFHWILGNHDIYYRDTLGVNAASVLCGNYPIIRYEWPVEVEFADVPILFVPWITKDIMDQFQQKIATTRAQIVFGHFELDGFEEARGHVHVGGMSPDMFSRFDCVLSGHFHQQSSKGNIRYLGAHSQFKWGDDGELRGFHIFDTETKELQFIENPLRVFEKVFYDDLNGDPVPPEGGFASLSNKIVKVIIKSRKNPEAYDWFMHQIEEAKPDDVKPVEDHLNLDKVDDIQLTSEAKDTPAIIKEYVARANTVNQIKLGKLFDELHSEAQLG